MATAKMADDEWMLKEDAAKFLGVTIRSVEKRARRGEIEFRYLPRLPKEKQARVVYKRASLDTILKGIAIVTGPSDPVTKRPLGETLPHATAALVLAKSAEGQAESWAALTRTLDKIGQRLEAPRNDEELAAHLAKLSAAFPTPQTKAWLTFAEAVEYSGLTAAMLETLIRDGEVIVLGRGRGTWRISRVSLDEYGKVGL